MALSHVKSVTIGDFTGTVTAFQSNGSTATVAATDLVRPADWNSAHNQYVTLTGNTAGHSAISGTNIVLAGGTNVTLSATTGAGAATISVVGADVSQYLTTAALSNHSHGNPTLNLTNLTGTTASASNGLTLSLSAGLPDVAQSFFMPFENANNSSFLVPGLNTIYFQHFVPPEQVIVSNVEMQALYSYATSTNSCQAAMTIRYGLYQYGAGASSNSIMSIATSSLSLQASYNSSTTGGFTIGNSEGSWTTNTNGGSNMFASLTGPRFLYFPFSTTLNGGHEYFWAMHWSSATTGNTGPLRLNSYYLSNMNSTQWGELKNTTVAYSATNQWEEFDAIQYSATSGGLPSGVDATACQMAASRGRMWLLFEGEA